MRIPPPRWSLPKVITPTNRIYLRECLAPVRFEAAVVPESFQGLVGQVK